MNRQNRETLDRATASVRAAEPDAEEIRRAADRVWARLAAEAGTAAAPAAAAAAARVETLAGCADVQAQIPAFVAGELPAARRLLIEDHTRECVPCRRALIAARTGRPATVAAPRPAASRPPRRLWLPLAAAVALAVGVAGWFATDGLFAGEVAAIADVDGLLLTLDGDAPGGVAPLAAGTMLDAGQAVRTGKGSTAVVRLTDGSLVELAPRTEMSVHARRRGTVIEVERGQVIVEAADQRPKQLFVATADAEVRVTGTIFAVQHGVRGSRVGVVEGEVRVDAGGREVVLHPGEATTSRASLAPVPVSRQVAWSRNVDHYLAMLEEIDALRREIARRVSPAESRFASALAPLVPADTFAYAAIPNLSATVAESWAIFQERLSASPNLAEWWAERQSAGEAAEIEDALARLTDLGEQLGDEVVVTFGARGRGEGGESLLVLAEVSNPDAFAAAVAAEAARHDAAELVVVRDLAELSGGEDGPIVWVSDAGWVAVGDRERLDAVAAAAAAGGGGFAGGELGQAVARAYADGTQWLLAFDLAQTIGAEAAHDAELAASGFGDAQRLVVESWGDGDRTVMSAELGFSGERRGIASWLAAPAPMGSLDFVSADAHLAAAFVVKEPSAMLDDLLAVSGGDDDQELAEIEAEIGLSLAEDVAAPLGGEIALAIDGPFLPEPSWKAIVEVYDPARLQHTLETAVARVNDRLRQEGEPELGLTSEEDGVHTWYRLEGRHFGVSWVTVDGYMVVAPSKALLERTLDQRAAGATLAASGRFRELLPPDARTHFSALLYQNLGPVLAPVADGLSNLGGEGMTESQRRTLAALTENAEPTVAYAYGEPDRVIFAGTGPGGPFGIALPSVGGIGGLGIYGALAEAAAQQAPGE